MSFEVPIRKHNGKIEARIRDAWSEIKRNAIEIDIYLGLGEGEETIVSSTDLIALSKFYQSGVNNQENNNGNGNGNGTENHKKSLSSRIIYVI